MGDIALSVDKFCRREGSMPLNLRLMSFCERVLWCSPTLLKVGEISVRLSGYDLRYKGHGEGFVKPVLKQLQMTLCLRTLQMDEYGD